jgi:hypothetical protein
VTEQQQQKAAELAARLREGEKKIPPVAFKLPAVKPHLELGREVVLFLEELAQQ